MAKGLLLLGLAVLTLTAVTYKQQAVIRGFNIQLTEGKEERLIDKTYLKSMLVKEFGSDLTNVPVEFVDLQDIEKLYNNNPYIKSAEVYIDKLGVLEIQVSERKPIMRVMDAEQSFYIDDVGVRVPLASKYAARLPIIHLPALATTFLTEKRRMELVNVVGEINKNTFVRALADQLELDIHNEYIIIPLLGTEKIKIGTINNLTDKLDRIKLFYQEKVANGHWSQCTYIDVRFEGQIVCDKNKT